MQTPAQLKSVADAMVPEQLRLLYLNEDQQLDQAHIRFSLAMRHVPSIFTFSLQAALSPVREQQQPLKQHLRLEHTQRR